MRNKTQVNLEREITKAEKEVVKAKAKLSRLRRRLPKLEVGVLKHLENRAAFVVVSPDAPEVQAKFASERGWKFRMLSNQGSTFTRDLGFERRDGGPIPGVSAFHRDKDGRIVRVGKARFGPGDDFCSVWHLFGLLRNGSGDWQPRFKY